MKSNIIVTGILKYEDTFLIIKRRETDEKFPGAWEFPGGHLEYSENISQALKRELKEEIGFNETFKSLITHYSDNVKKIRDELIYDLEMDFLIEVDEKPTITLSEEHSDYLWVKKDSELLDDFIKDKLSNIKD